MEFGIPVRIRFVLALFLSVCCSLAQTARSSERAGIVEAAGRSTPQGDIVVMTAKVTSARRYFETTWAEFFRKRGTPYKSPAIVAYQRPISTPCGMQPPGNAFYCPPANAIYYDEAFLTALMKKGGW
jgi:predicted metalloprotease